MRPKPYPEHFATFRKAALQAELAGKTLRTMSRASTSITSTSERLQRIADQVSGADLQPAPSPFEMYRQTRQ